MNNSLNDSYYRLSSLINGIANGFYSDLEALKAYLERVGQDTFYLREIAAVDIAYHLDKQILRKRQLPPSEGISERVDVLIDFISTRVHHGSAALLALMCDCRLGYAISYLHGGADMTSFVGDILSYACNIPSSPQSLIASRFLRAAPDSWFANLELSDKKERRFLANAIGAERLLRINGKPELKRGLLTDDLEL